jgi:MGT family glycosyltransferase
MFVTYDFLGLYPYNWNELCIMGLTSSWKSIAINLADLVHYIYTYYKILFWDLGFSVSEIWRLCHGPMAFDDFLTNENLSLVFILPELQPHVELFKPVKQILFLGSSIDEEVRATMTIGSYSGDKSMELVNKYLESQQKKPLIYVSIGTTFNLENGDLFELLIETCKHYSDRHAIIISTGSEDLYIKYSYKFINSSMLLLPHVPQIEVLKKAHLFLTHAGMNSISEALHYGVPIVCIPLHGDQPLIAWRIADELQMGLRLLSNKQLNIEKLTGALDKVLENPKYRLRAKELSEISQQHNGHITASELTLEYIKRKNL